MRRKTYNVRTILLLGSRYENSPLESIIDELYDIRKLLQHTDAKVIYQPYLNKEILTGVFQEYMNNIDIIHFAGHSSEHTLQSDEEVLYISRISKILSIWEIQPKLIFINGCNSIGQVESLLSVGVNCIIATNGYIPDIQAKLLAVNFFTYLKKKASIYESLKLAYNSLQMNKDTVKSRSFILKSKNKNMEWKAFTKSEESPKSIYLSFQYQNIKKIKMIASLIITLLLVYFISLFLYSILIPPKVSTNSFIFDDKINIGNLLDPVKEIHNYHCDQLSSRIGKNLLGIPCHKIILLPPLSTLVACSKKSMNFIDVAPLTIIEDIENEFGHCFISKIKNENIILNPISKNITTQTIYEEEFNICKCI